MDDLELTKTIDQVRRAMPRNLAVMTLCDELERRVRGLIQTKSGLITQAQAQEELEKAASAAGFDRKAYMRGYMKKKRAEKAKRKGSK